MRISVELVPRSRETLLDDLEVVRSDERVGMVNVPDLTGRRISSLEAARLLSPRSDLPIMPHIRAMDHEVERVEEIVECLEESDTGRVLVVRGDPPKNAERKVYDTTSAQLIAALKCVAPSLVVFAGFDPYRDFGKEMERVQAKRDAGASGFFTQPLFSLPAIEVLASQLSDDVVFWGLTPVHSRWSCSYWERQGVMFPVDFAPTREWNARFARKVLRWVEKEFSQHSAYLMPIKVSVAQYLNDVL